MASSKKKTAFFCQECGYESAKWTGQCPACRAWNTMVEEPVKMTGTGGPPGRAPRIGQERMPVSLSAVKEGGEVRFPTGFGELDRVLGGGIVKGSLILVGGDPGIGKSTLLLQATANIAAAGHRVLYISGEESLHQIKLRADRVGSFGDNARFLCETELDTITQILPREKPDLVIIDSIQTMYNSGVQSAPGSVSQVRETTAVLLRLAKETGITFFIVGHVTKEGTVAGPRVLEHMVDTVLYFEGDRYASYRVLRGVKNIVTCSMEGTRPLLTEVQALVFQTNYGYPKRQATGTDYNRVNLLMAVLEKRLGIPMSDYDAYINLAGGVRQTEPALDLGIVMAILSSFRNTPLPDDMVAFGEVGLSGEVRSVTMAEARVQEARKLGFTTCLLPAGSLARLKAPEGMRLIGISGLQQVLDYI